MPNSKSNSNCSKPTVDNLPSNYVQIVKEQLEKQDINLSYTKLYDIIRGKYKLSELTLKVFKEVKRLEVKQQKLKTSLEKLQSR